MTSPQRRRWFITVRQTDKNTHSQTRLHWRTWAEQKYLSVFILYSLLRLLHAVTPPRPGGAPAARTCPVNHHSSLTCVALCPRRPASTRPTRRCSSTASRTSPVGNSTTSGLLPWRRPDGATSAQRSPWSPLGKVGGACRAAEGVDISKRAVLSSSSLLLLLLLSPPAVSVIDWQPLYWLSSGYMARNAVVNYVVMNRAYPVNWPLGREVAGEDQ